MFLLSTFHAQCPQVGVYLRLKLVKYVFSRYNEPLHTSLYESMYALTHIQTIFLYAINPQENLNIFQ